MLFRFPWRLAVAVLAFRLFNAAVVVTYFDPDEYWQSREVAHRIVYGTGHLTWEWSDGARIRGYAHPFIFVALYRALNFLGVDSPDIVAISPRILQGCFAALGDIATYMLAHKLYGRRAAACALGVQALNWFYFYCAVRTYSNSIEMVLVAFGVLFWPHFPAVNQVKHRRIALICAVASVVIRPTSGIVWFYVGIRHAVITWQRSSWRRALQFCATDAAGSAAFALMASALIDYLGYGVWTCTPLNFIRINIFHGISKYYGVHPWYWYIIEGFPATTGTFLPFVLAGLCAEVAKDIRAIHANGDDDASGKAKSRHRASPVAGIVLWLIFFLSLNPHKELRFLLRRSPYARC